MLPRSAMMKKMILIVMIFLIASAVFAVNKRRVYITLDVSGSMNNDKYILANYTAQLISTLCEQDEVYLIILGHAEKISGTADIYKKIQIRYDNIHLQWKVSERESQIEDIDEFNQIFKDEKDVDQWLFVVGDGIWDTPVHPLITNKFKNIVTDGKVHVCFLQTGASKAEHNDFTSFLEGLKIVNILKSSIDPSTIIEDCNIFTSTILGLSSTSLKVERSGTTCMNVTSLLPSRKWIVLFQDEIMEAQLPKLLFVKQNGKTLTFQHKGSPSNSSLISPVASKLVSGNVWTIHPGIPIMPKMPVTLCFNKPVDLNRIKVFPLVDVSLTHSGVKISSGTAKTINETTVSICKENKTAVIKINLSDDKGMLLPEAILKNTTANVISNNSTYRAIYVNGGFECTIPLSDETTLYYSKSECKGYFTRTSKIFRIVRDQDCAKTPPTPPDTTLPSQVMGSISFNQLMRGDCVEGILLDVGTLETLDPAKFDIKVSHNYPLLFKKVELKISGNKLLLCFEPRGEWCDCFFPDTLQLVAKISPKPGAALGGKVYANRIIPLKVGILKSSWISRCKWIIISMIAALLLFIYLFALSKKDRFKRGSVVISEYGDYYNKYPPYKFSLRKKGFNHWLNRWLNPFGSENKLISFQQVGKSINFIATRSRFRIKFPVSAFDSKTMRYSDYDEDSKDPFVQFSSGNTLTIRKNITDDGKMKLEYDSKEGVHDDIPSFKMFLALLMFAVTIFFFASGFLLIQSLI
ncbi:MAG: hypothetical protein NTW16_04750 [Bacteroidetes bacterium]|nr:hypothetical protein [Bacteroidota bacterium]